MQGVEFFYTKQQAVLIVTFTTHRYMYAVGGVGVPVGVRRGLRDSEVSQSGTLLGISYCVHTFSFRETV